MGGKSTTTEEEVLEKEPLFFYASPFLMIYSALCVCVLNSFAFFIAPDVFTVVYQVDGQTRQFSNSLFSTYYLLHYVVVLDHNQRLSLMRISRMLRI